MAWFVAGFPSLLNVPEQAQNSPVFYKITNQANSRKGVALIEKQYRKYFRASN
jgi:hypothetical protein